MSAAVGGTQHTPYFDPATIRLAQERAAAIYDRNKDPERLATAVRQSYADQALVTALQSSLSGLRERKYCDFGFSLRKDLALTEQGFKSSSHEYKCLRVTDLDKTLQLADHESLQAALRALDTRLAECSQDPEEHAVVVREQDKPTPMPERRRRRLGLFGRKHR